MSDVSLQALNYTPHRRATPRLGSRCKWQACLHLPITSMARRTETVLSAARRIRSVSRWEPKAPSLSAFCAISRAVRPREVFCLGSARARRRKLMILSWPRLAATWMGHMDSGLLKRKQPLGTCCSFTSISRKLLARSQGLICFKACICTSSLFVRSAVASTSTCSSSRGSW